MSEQAETKQEPANVKTIMTGWLIEHGFDGLYHEGCEESDCGCRLEDDFMPCDSYTDSSDPSKCKPGYVQPANEDSFWSVGPDKPAPAEGEKT